MLDYSKIQYEEEFNEQVDPAFSNITLSGWKQEDGAKAFKSIGRNLSFYDSQDQSTAYVSEILIKAYIEYKNNLSDIEKSLKNLKEIVKTLNTQLSSDQIFPIGNKLSIVDFCMASIFESDSNNLLKDLIQPHPSLKNYFNRLTSTLSLKVVLEQEESKAQ